MLYVGLVFVYAVVVAGDGAGADVYAGAHVGVAYVTQVVHFAAGAGVGVFGFYEITDLGAFGQLGGGAQAGEGSDGAGGGCLGLINDAGGVETGAGTGGAGFQAAVWPGMRA